MEIRKSDKATKRYMAIVNDGKKKIYFGQPNGQTFIDHNDKVKRENYIKRHKVRENWNDPYTPGALSRYILWEKPSLREAIVAFSKRFGMHVKS